MRHFRSLLWFFVGILLVSIPMFSYAINMQVGKYHQIDTSVVRSMSDTARVVSTNNFTARMADTATVNLTSELTATMEKGLVRVPIVDTVAADIGIFTRLGRQSARCISSGIAFAACAAGAAATDYVFNKLLEKGMQMMDDAKCQVTAGCTKPGFNQVVVLPPTPQPTIGGQYRFYGSVYPSLQAAINASVCGVQTCKTTISFDGYATYWVRAEWTMPYGPQATSFPIGVDNFGSCPQGYGLDTPSGSCLPTTPQQTYSPITQDQIEAAVDDAIKNNISAFVDAVRKDGTVISVDDSTKTTTSGSTVSGQAIPSQTTTTNPDGTTNTKNEITQKQYTPSGSGKVADPIVINTTTNKTTNTCTGAGSCSTTNTTQSDPPADNKTQCDLYPGSLACAGLGDPSDADIPSKTVNADYYQDGRISFAHSCPAPEPYTVHGVVSYYDWTPVCNFAIKIKSVVIICAGLMAAFIIAYGHKK